MSPLGSPSEAGALAPEIAWSPPGWPAERPSGGGAVEAWCYTDRFSYAPGEQVQVHVLATAPTYDLIVTRDGAEPEVVWERSGLAGVDAPTPAEAYAAGCGWPVGVSFEIPSDWPSGFHLLTIAVDLPDGSRWEREHFFVVLAPAPASPFVLVHATSTLLAYNDWGGANHYRGLSDDPRVDVGSPLSAVRRPIARGMLRKPASAPREANRFTPPIGFTPTYPPYEWARLHGYGRHHADAGWATYEGPFTRWAQQHGYAVDHLTQHDLHERPDALDGYACALFVGHDEYWSWEMRDAVDRFVDGGGNVARFGGNFIWQVRLEDDGATQACYRLPSLDPAAAETPRLATTIWDARSVGRPGAATLGLSGTAGCYNRYGAAAPRSSGGYTVYRPGHWLFAGTDLRYGDQLGALPVGIATFELDGVEFTFRKGLPYPTHEDGAPEGLEILAMCPATAGERDTWAGTVPLSANVKELDELYEGLGDDLPDYLRDHEYGAGMLACFERGGTVVNTGATEWVVGLIERDPFVERITHNVLRRLGGLA
ncbi:N,N-dimethylformamidase beta subunit family domain-containing protein [Conexibacter stalactiti]|uniref:DUF6605 domain-containing protein n=1 Tax=Conexibacter stalactiti TaxID=1940611 RepID=A0ABU4HMY3_9ACTN|nr:N,N-dimethylformamidase beta subunit family domain-containing protein [Conexibacter stalactiti]MDW5593404.1 DUF6605 domain-containing protein [Conexibacter stalactiti]MEC5034045.1 N,N-dimethylformamidase beta subunit family domain-containing protein [Conexibacter stalactiti]